jgi:hypothetical protein
MKPLIAASFNNSVFDWFIVSLVGWLVCGGIGAISGRLYQVKQAYHAIRQRIVERLRPLGRSEDY